MTDHNALSRKFLIIALVDAAIILAGVGAWMITDEILWFVGACVISFATMPFAVFKASRDAAGGKTPGGIVEDARERR